MRRLSPAYAIRGALLVVSLGASACGDVVVGSFSGTTEPADADSTGATPSVAPPVDDPSTTDDPGEPPFVSCYTDDFEGAEVDDSRWNTWTEEDSAVALMAGSVAFTPPSTGVFDTGLVGHIDHNFVFRDGWARMRVGTPPSVDRPVSLFLLMDQNPNSLFIRISQGKIAIQGSVNQEVVFGESFETDPYPRWLGIRGDGERVHFEISDDGQAWQTLATHDKPSIYDDAAMIIMAQTHGEDLGQEVVSVDRFEACL